MKNLSKNKNIVIFLATILVGIFWSGQALALGQYQANSIGVDISYPNCNAKIPSVAFGVVGVNGGKPFSQNPCLKQQAAKFKNLSLYINTAYPGQPYGIKYQTNPKTCSELDFTCLAYNYGYNAAADAYKYATEQGVKSNSWWLDVETMNSWTDDSVQNRASLQAMIDFLQKDKGIQTVGIYSTTFQWMLITDSWQNNLPSWGATTWRTAKQAANYCSGHEFTGGPSYLMQYLSKSLDYNVAC